MNAATFIALLVLLILVALWITKQYLEWSDRQAASYKNTQDRIDPYSGPIVVSESEKAKKARIEKEERAKDRLKLRTMACKNCESTIAFTLFNCQSYDKTEDGKYQLDCPACKTLQVVPDFQ